jgi:hypothetical protein
MILSFLYLEQEIKAAATTDSTFSLLVEEDWGFLKELNKLLEIFKDATLDMSHTTKSTVAEWNFTFEDILKRVGVLGDQWDADELTGDLTEAADLARNKLNKYYQYQANPYIMAATGINACLILVLDARFKLKGYDGCSNPEERTTLKSVAMEHLRSMLKEREEYPLNQHNEIQSTVQPVPKKHRFDFLCSEASSAVSRYHQSGKLNYKPTLTLRLSHMSQMY